MKKTLFTILAITTLTLTACATNEHDAAIAESSASIERTKELAYADSIKAANAPKKSVEIKGEIKCSKNQIKSNECGVIFYSQTAISIAPQRDKNWVDGLESVGNTLVRATNALMPIMLAKEVTNIVKASSANAGNNTTNSNSYNSQANQSNSETTANVTSTETVSGIKAGGDIDQSQQNQSNTSTVTDASTITDTSTVTETSTVTNTDDNSTSDSNNIDDNSSTVTNEAAPIIP